MSYIDEQVALLEAHYPDIWKRIYTKHIDAPGNYLSFKHFAAVTAMGVSNAQLMYKRGKRLVSNVGAIAAVLEQYDFPTYYVTASLLQAMSMTHAPAGMRWKDIHMPFEGLIFMLPLGVLKNPEGHPIFAIGVTRYLSSIVGMDGLKIAASFQTGTMDVFWIDTPPAGTAQDCAFSAEELLEPDPDDIDRKTEQMREIGAIPRDQELVTGKFASFMAGLAANLILVMQARPELVEAGERTKRKLKNGAVVHTPTFIGRKYAIRTKYPKGHIPTGKFTVLKWRAGHLKRRHAEKGWDDPDNIRFIEPYMAYSAGLVREAVTVTGAGK